MHPHNGGLQDYSHCFPPVFNEWSIYIVPCVFPRQRKLFGDTQLDVAAIETFDDLIQALVKVESLTVQEKWPHQDKIVPGQSSPTQTKPLWNLGTDTQIT